MPGPAAALAQCQGSSTNPTILAYPRARCGPVHSPRATELLADEEVIRLFPRTNAAPESGYIVNYLGCRTRAEYIAALPQAGAVVEDYPIPGNFHATALEWAGVLRAVLDARQQLTVVELGAGWGPWLVNAALAARMCGVNDISLVGVEGDQTHSQWMKTHLEDNQIDPDIHTLIHGIVGPRDGMAEFPVITNPADAWGPKAVFSGGRLAFLRRAVRQGRQLLGRCPATVTLRCLSLPTLLKSFDVVDLVHVDIQGAEVEVIARARRVLQQKVKRLVIGTHGRRIEELLFDELASAGWTLEADEACSFRQSGSRLTLYLDGCQVWRNGRLAG